ncbi:MAG: LysM peptidoglycan-binding domain-containing protein [Flavobacteriales bacterium]|nr:LysM peptidoglycan-binding domain-containing protein [Flavobacteriales bacterium]
MKRFFSIFLFVFLQSVLAQQTNHTVQEGETISKIAQKYKVTPFDIYKLNPDAQTGVKPGMVLAIPKSVAQDGTIETKPVEVKPVVTKPVVTKPTETKPVVTTSSQKTHTVKAKESLYGISKQYGITIDELEKNNPILKETGLQPGQVLVIKKGANSVKSTPVVKPTSAVKPVASNSSGIITHQVQPKETKYGIATKYGITVEELERQNPDVVDNLPIGFVLKINKNGKTITTTSEPEKPKEIKQVAAKPLFNYTVKEGDTFYSLTKSLGLTQEELTKLNPELSDGLKEGMTLKIPVDLSAVSSPSKASTNLVNSISKSDKKHLVLLIPFNVSKIEMDTVKTLNSKFKDDKFLNMTLDFYSGVMMAIDSAKVLGLNVDVSIFDSEETKTTTSAVSTLQNKASNADAVIGPFFQANVEKVAQSLESKKVPVISPLSKEVSTSYANLYNSMPSEYAQKKAIFDYMNGKNGNVIALVDADKTNSKTFISEYGKNVKWVGLSSKGTFVSDSIKKHFVKDRMNFVVMESEKYETIQTTLTAVNSSLKDYSVQIVVLEANEMLDFEEISLNSLVKSKLTYPSLYRENESAEAIQFEKSFRKKNKVLPNQFATRGFDLTFDTMLRLSQGKPFEETIQDAASEQVESKFDYAKNSNGGYLNKGVYILTYQPDLTIKEAQ